jgi:hypothetical protein
MSLRASAFDQAIDSRVAELGLVRVPRIARKERRAGEEGAEEAGRR